MDDITKYNASKLYIKSNCNCLKRIFISKKEFLLILNNAIFNYLYALFIFKQLKEGVI